MIVTLARRATCGLGRGPVTRAGARGTAVGLNVRADARRVQMARGPELGADCELGGGCEPMLISDRRRASAKWECGWCGSSGANSACWLSETRLINSSPIDDMCSCVGWGFDRSMFIPGRHGLGWSEAHPLWLTRPSLLVRPQWLVRVEGDGEESLPGRGVECQSSASWSSSE